MFRLLKVTVSIKELICSLLILLIMSATSLAAIELDGANEFINCGSGSSIDNISPMTISLWVYPYSAGAGKYGILFRKQHAPNGSYVTQFITAPNNKLSFSVEYSNRTLCKDTIANVVSFNQWQHLLVTWNGSQSYTGVHIYINGSEVGHGFVQNGTGSKDDSNYDLTIGATPTGGAPFYGQLTEYAVWNKVLSADEIALLANSGIKGKPLQVQSTNLVAYWPLDDGESGASAVGDIATDVVAGNNGNCLGGTWREETFLIPPANPTASVGASPTQGLAPLEVYFTGGGNDPDGVILYYNWDFGDGDTSSEQNPIHIYSNPGNYVATLTVTDNDWLTGTASIAITVQDSFTPTEIPHLIRFQARLEGANAEPLDGAVDLTFRLYETDIAGTALWEETQEGVVVEEGMLDVELGSVTPLDLPFDKQYWLAVEVESDGEMIPRFKLTTVPYSFTSE